MPRESKTPELLASLEADIQGRLEAILPSVVVDGRPIFTNREFNPHDLFAAHYGRENDELLDLCRRAEALRNRHGVRDPHAPSALYLAACAEAADLSNSHRLGPRRLAERLLRELRTGQRQ